MTKKKSRSKKDLIMQIGVVVLLIAFAAYFLLSNVLVRNESANKDLDKAVNTKTSFSFVKQGELIFLNSKGDTITKIDIEIADNDEKRSTGLMYRDKMDESQGMLFLFDTEEPQSFWMKNTILPLDIIFVNAKMEIVKIQKNAEPFSEKSLPSIKPAQYVVEVNAGYCERHGVKEGDKIAWRKE
jgi:uncharacterized protein